MKSIVIMFMLSMLVQPVPVAACDMESDQDSTHHAAMADLDGKHDCCDTADSENDHACSDVSSCGSCPAGLSLMHSSASNPAGGMARQFSRIQADSLLAFHSHPLLRPPIS